MIEVPIRKIEVKEYTELLADNLRAKIIKASEEYALFEIFTDDEKQDAEYLFNKVVHSKDHNDVIRVGVKKSVKHESVIEVPMTIGEWNLIGLKRRDVSRLSGVGQNGEYRIYIKPNTYQENILLRSMYSLIDAPRSHQRVLLKFFEKKDHARFDAFRLEPVNDWIFLTNEEFRGTDQQRHFVRMALSTPDLAILEGPPGSGKTTAICELIYQAIRRGQRVMLAASTNVAVDNVIEKLMDNNHPRFKDLRSVVLPVRIGKSDNVSHSVNRYRGEVMWEETKQELIETLRSQPEITLAQQEYLEYLEKQDTRRERNLLNHFIQNAPLVCGTIYGILRHPLLRMLNRRVTSNLVYPPYDLLIIDEASKTTFQDFLVPARYAKKYIIIGDPMQLSPFVDDNGISSNLEVFEVNDQGVEEEFSIGDKLKLNTFLTNFNKVWRKEDCCVLLVDTKFTRYVRDYLKTLAKKLSNHPFVDTLQGKYYIGANILISDLRSLQKQQDKIPLRVRWYCDFRTSPIVYSLRERYSPFNNLDIFQRRINVARNKIKYGEPRSQDESWTEAISWRMIRQYETRENTPKNIADDMKVLQTSVDESLIMEIGRLILPSIIELLLNGYGQSEYHKNKGIETSLNLGLPRSVQQSRRVLLQYQHRMHPDISAFARKHFYDGKALMDDTAHTKRELYRRLGYGSPFLMKHVKRKKEVGSGKRRKPRRYSYERQDENRYEVNSMLDELGKILDKLPQNGTHRIALLTFYKSQFRLICQELANNLRAEKEKILKRERFNVFMGKNVEVVINIVDKFQGQEADIVFLSMTRNRGTGFLDNPNRLNVALTRARHLQIIFADKNFLKKQKSRSKALASLSSLTPIRTYGGNTQ